MYYIVYLDEPLYPIERVTDEYARDMMEADAPVAYFKTLKAAQQYAEQMYNENRSCTIVNNPMSTIRETDSDFYDWEM